MPTSEPTKFAIPAEVLRDHDGAIEVFVGKITRGDPYGYFDHETGAAEPPSGPEADIVKVLDVQTGAKIELSDADYDRVVEAVAEAAYAVEDEPEPADDEDYEYDNNPEQLGFDESDLQ